MQGIGGCAEDLRAHDLDSVGEEDAEGTRNVSLAVALYIGQQRAQVLGIMQSE